jgi:hypothetical protein
MALRRALSGLTLVVIGLVLLANTTGYLPWSVWWGIIALWPLLLISAGLDALGKSLDNEWIRVLGSLLVIAGIAWGAFGGTNGIPPVGAPFVTASASQPYDLALEHDPAVQTGDARIVAGLGRLALGAGDRLATARGLSPWGTPTLTRDGTGSPAKVVFESASQPSAHVGALPRAEATVTLDAAVMWENVTVEAGLSDARIDLSALRVRNLTADLGLANSAVILPREGQATIKSGLGAVSIAVPSRVVSEVEVENGLGTTSAGSGWTRVSGEGGHTVWRSGGTGTVALRVKVDAGLGTVRLATYDEVGSLVPGRGFAYPPGVGAYY